MNDPEMESAEAGPNGSSLPIPLVFTLEEEEKKKDFRELS